MPNQRVNAPYGDIYFTSTPNLDRVGAMMINDQKQRDLQQARSLQNLDAEFSKNVAGVKDADVPELSEKYGQYKLAKQALYKNGNKMSDKDRIAAELDAQRKLGDAFKLINASKKEKQDEDFYAKDLEKNANNYNDDAHEKLILRRQTPTSKLKGADYDYTDIPSMTQYKQGTTDFTPVITKAKGNAALRGAAVETKTPDGLQTKVTQYKAGNSPSEYINMLQAGVVGSKKTKHLPLEFNYSEDEANQIATDYMKLKETPAFKAAYPNEPEISPLLLETPTGRTMALMAMENALMNPPTPVVRNPYTNKGAVDAANEARWGKHNRITFAQSLDKIRANKGATDENGLRYLTDEYVVKAGKTTTLPNGEAVNYIEVKDIDAGDLQTISGFDPSKKNPGVKPMEIGDKQVYRVLDNGDWEGRDGKIISRDAVLDRYAKGKPKVTINVSSKGDRSTSTQGKAASSNKWDKYRTK